MSISQASASSNVNTTGTSYAVVNDDMKLTGLSAGKYLVTFSAIAYTDGHSGAMLGVHFALFANGSEIGGSGGHTERVVMRETSTSTNCRWTVETHAVVTIGANEQIDCRWKVDSGETGYCEDRSLTVMPFTGTHYSATATATDTKLDDTFDVLDGMTATPVSGTYLLLWSSYIEANDGDSSNEPVGVFRVYQNASHSGLEHTERRAMEESSFWYEPQPLATFCKMTPPGSQAVDIRWAQAVDTTATLSCYQRTLLLVPVDSADIKEASSTTTANATNTAYALMSAMDITTAGDNDWFAFFSCWHDNGTGAVEYHVDFTFYEGGSQDTPSERRTSIDDSYDANDVRPGLMTGLVQPGSGDIEVWWKCNSSNQRNVYDRCVVTIREESGPPPAGPALWMLSSNLRW